MRLIAIQHLDQPHPKQINHFPGEFTRICDICCSLPCCDLSRPGCVTEAQLVGLCFGGWDDKREVRSPEMFRAFLAAADALARSEVRARRDKISIAMMRVFIGCDQ